jgi:hypothetical protein
MYISSITHTYLRMNTQLQHKRWKHSYSTLVEYKLEKRHLHIYNLYLPNFAWYSLNIYDMSIVQF